MGIAGCVIPVTPSVQFETSSFEGFTVVAYVPDNPAGIVYLFHGTAGSADFANQLEQVDVINGLVADGYGFVSTSSTDRTGPVRWDVADPLLTTNPDLARLVRLHAELISSTGVDATTPIFGIGHSNGARFVTLWGQSWSDAGYPVAAIWASSGRIATPVSGIGELTVPTVFSTAVNDFTSPPLPIIAGYAATVDAGTPAELYVATERRLGLAPFLRIPTVTATEADEIVAALTATGVWSESGNRVVADVAQAADQAGAMVLPASLVGRGLVGDIRSQTKIVLAIHQFSAEFAGPVRAFFSSHSSG